MPIIPALAISVAAALLLQRLTSGKTKAFPKTPVDYGKAWSGWALFYVTIAALPGFLMQPHADPLAVWLLGIIIFGLFAFIGGYLYCKLFKRKNAYAPKINMATRNDNEKASTTILTEISNPNTQNDKTRSSNQMNTITKPPPMVDPQLDTTFQPVSTSIPHPFIDEEKIYAIIAEEIDSGTIDKGLWTRLFAECDGDERQTRVLYIKRRAERLINAEKNRIEKSPNRSNGIRIENTNITEADSNQLVNLNGGVPEKSEKSSPPVKVKIFTCENCKTVKVFLQSEISPDMKCEKCQNPIKAQNPKIDSEAKVQSLETKNHKTETRALCGDDSCTGTIRDNGRCGYCGKTFEEGQKENDITQPSADTWRWRF